jgi:hypothetical protein
LVQYRQVAYRWTILHLFPIFKIRTQGHLSEYWVQINNTFVQALAKSPEKAPKHYNSKQDFENYRKTVIDVLEDGFTGLFSSKEYAILCGLAQSNVYDLFTHFRKLAEDNLKVINLPTRSEMDDLSKGSEIDAKSSIYLIMKKIE